MNQNTHKMQTETHNEAILLLKERKQKLDQAYNDLVVNGTVNPNQKVSIDNRMQSNNLGKAIEILMLEKTREKRQENLFAIILGTITVTITVGFLLVLLALYLNQYFQENNIDFEMF